MGTPVHPWRSTWDIIMEVWKIIFLSKWVICRFHVNLPGCNPYAVLCFSYLWWYVYAKPFWRIHVGGRPGIQFPLNCDEVLSLFHTHRRMGHIRKGTLMHVIRMLMFAKLQRWEGLCDEGSCIYPLCLELYIAFVESMRIWLQTSLVMFSTQGPIK